MTPNTQCRIWWDASVQGYRLTSGYNKELVETLHQLIPVSDRSWDAESKIWTFSEKYLQPLHSTLITLGFQVVVITRQQAEQTAAKQATGQSTGAGRGRPLDAVIIEFVKLIPYDAMKKAYRAAAQDLHPDKQGGASDKMSSLNANWDRIAKEVYGQ